VEQEAYFEGEIKIPQALLCLPKMELYINQIQSCNDESSVLDTMSAILADLGQEQLSTLIGSWSPTPLSQRPKVAKPSIREIESMVFNHSTSSTIRENLRIYLAQRISKLPTVGKKLEVSTQKDRFALNPSIVRYDNGYLCIVRVVNYEINNGIYTIYDPDNIIKTTNLLLELDANLRIISSREIQGPIPIYPSKCQGMEDCRIFTVDNQDLGMRAGFTCTTLDNNPECIPQISLAWLPEDWKRQDPVVVSEVTLQQGPTKGRMEKNWLPYQEGSDIHAYYSYSPLTKLCLSSSGTTTYAEKIDLPLEFDFFRGSAGPINYKDGHLLVVHEVAWISKGRAIYSHRFLQIGTEGPVAISHQWYLEKIGIEFVSGLEWSLDGQSLILTAGIQDRTPWIFTTSISDVEKILIPVEEYISNHS